MTSTLTHAILDLSLILTGYAGFWILFNVDFPPGLFWPFTVVLSSLFIFTGFLGFYALAKEQADQLDL